MTTHNAQQAQAPDDRAGLRFDYDRQAWMRDGRYIRCGHPADPLTGRAACDCYGRIHAGQTPEEAEAQDQERQQAQAQAEAALAGIPHADAQAIRAMQAEAAAAHAFEQLARQIADAITAVLERRAPGIRRDEA